MYFRGRITINLTGSYELTPPGNFFGRVAHLLTHGSWQKREEMELYKLMAFAQSTNRALMELGVRNVARVAIGSEVVYEDPEGSDDDWGAALQALEARLANGFEPDPHLDFDLVLKHDDAILNYVIDLDYQREHVVGKDPVAILVTAIPSELRRKPDEDELAFRSRAELFFRDQASFDGWITYWDDRFQQFLNQIGDHFRTNLGVEDVRIDSRKILPRHRDVEWMDTYTDFGYPLYGYDPFYDLAYMAMWDQMWAANALVARDMYYGDYGAPYVYVGDNGWSYTDANQYDTTYAAPPVTADSGNDWAPAMAPSASDSGGGGWLNNISDFSSDSGGGGTIDSGSPSCSSASSCNSNSSSCNSNSSSCNSSTSSCSSSSSSCSSSSSSCSSSSSSCGGGGCSSS